MSDTQGFKFGVELEGLVGSIPIEGALKQAGVQNHVSVLGDKTKAKYEEWWVTQDGSLDDNQENNVVGVEFVSPVFTYDDRKNWTGQIEKVYEVVKDYPFFFHTNFSCVTHVAEAIVYHDDALRALAGDKHPEWARPNTDNAILRGFSKSYVLKVVAGATTVTELVRRMCTFQHDPSDAGMYHWNFWHIVGLTKSGFAHEYGDDNRDEEPEEPEQENYAAAADDDDDEQAGTETSASSESSTSSDYPIYQKINTLELRLPPGSDTPAKAILWIDFTHLFVLAAIRRSAP
ncbi:Uu.00g037900.m01.CDS01 [Anthostomella pinea]|uniref:Uu.00g037900.m01.CDS01 n=1 Tax=Anthostomella pinea TaxID=933095 RepID=A0AAI8VAC8_9PEZI|nr:Uu.00g037900.m01.CDS01 [Anthostomella pinea]